METVTIRVFESDLEQWKKCANLSGFSVSEWIRRQCNGGVSDREQFSREPQPEGGGNGSASNQNVSRIPEANSSGRRSGASERRSVRRGNNTVKRIADVTNQTLRDVSKRVSRVPFRDNAVENIVSHAGINSDSIIAQVVTRENFAEVLATIPKDDIDRWARSLPAEVLPAHDGNRHTCVCQHCLWYRKTNAIPYGGPVKKEKK